MRRILEFLAADGAFLYEDLDFRIADSAYIATFGGTGSVTLQNKVLELRIWLDRHLMFLDLRAIGTKAAGSSFSIDIIRQLLTGEVTDKAQMDAMNVAFLQRHIEKIQDLFRPANLANTEATCRKLEEQRAKRLFG